MKSISGKEFAKLLENKGWELKRIKGSHHVYIKSGKQEGSKKQEGSDLEYRNYFIKNKEITKHSESRKITLPLLPCFNIYIDKSPKSVLRQINLVKYN